MPTVTVINYSRIRRRTTAVSETGLASAAHFLNEKNSTMNFLDYAQGCIWPMFSRRWFFSSKNIFLDRADVFSIEYTRKANCFPEPTFKIWGKLGVGVPVILLLPDSFHWLSWSNVKFWLKEPRVVAEAVRSGRHGGWVRSAVSISVEPTKWLNLLKLKLWFHC